MKVRRASVEDKPAIIGLLETMFDENALAPLNRVKAEKVIDEVFSNGMVLIVESDDGRAVGTAGLAVNSWWYSDAKYVGDYWLFVSHEARRGRAAIMLIGAVRAAAKAIGLPLLTGPVTRARPEEKSRFYRRLGLVPVGGLFMEGQVDGRLLRH